MPRNPAPPRHLTERAALLVVVLAAAALAFYKVRVAVVVGPEWDTYAFLANAADFAGKGFGYTEPHRAPLISLLTSIVFRFSALQTSAIQWIDGALSVSGIVAFYLVLKRRFEPVPSVAGALLLFAVQPLWAYVGAGYTDFGSIALSLWVLLACIKATEDHPAWFLLAGPLFTAAIMMRYTAILFAFPALVWVLLRWRPFRQARWILGGLGTAIAAYLPAAIHYTRLFGDALFPFIVAFAFSETVTVPGGEGQAQATGGWYITQLPRFLASENLRVIALFVLLAGALGLLRVAGDYLARSSTRPSRIAIAVLGVAVAVLAQLGAGLVARQFMIPIAVLAVWRSFAPYEESEDKHRSVIATATLDATMLTMLFTYLDFHGHQTIQVPRYFITMAPSIIYLTLLGWREWARTLSELRRGLGRRTESAPQRVNATVGIAFLVLSCVLVATTALSTPSEPNPLVVAARDSAQHMAAAEPDISSATVYSDVWPYTSWYLRMNVLPMPTFEDLEAFGHELEKYDADVFFTIRGRRFASFSETYRNDEVTVLTRSQPAPDELARVQYLGKSWDNYLESVTDYDFYLMSTAGRYGWEGSAFLDAFTAEELAGSDAVAAYGWRWLDRFAGEKELEQFVREGGSLIVDASQNMDELAYSVSGTIMFDTFIRPGTAAPDATIQLRDDFAAAHPELGDIESAPFIDENGGAWTGATYTARPGTEPLETLVTVGGAPAIQVRRIGDGAVYFIGYNLVWHAFSAENADESELIRAVFDDAILRAPDLKASGPRS